LTGVDTRVDNLRNTASLWVLVSVPVSTGVRLCASEARATNKNNTKK
jgi:hypothetical protein